jgi:membrane fusion protein (multidrug efflux system)
VNDRTKILPELSPGHWPQRWLLLGCAIAGLVGCKPEDGKPKPDAAVAQQGTTPEIRPSLVELETARVGRIERLLERSSALVAEEQVRVLARTANPAIELLVEQGDKVTKDQVLLRLESVRQQNAYDQAASQLAKAKIERDKQKLLFDQDLISESAMQDAQFAVDQADLRAGNARRELEFTEVRAPISGTITSRTVKVGDSVHQGNPVFEIINLESTVAIIHVPEQYLPRLKADMPARLISPTYDNQIFKGYVKRVSPIVEARAGTVEVVVGIRELGALRPGMWVNVELVLESKEDALLIPKRAIVYDNDQIFAFKEYTDAAGIRRARRHLVEPVNLDKENIEPRENFKTGDRIVVAGQVGLKDDQPIREIGQPKTIPDPAASTNALAVATNGVVLPGPTGPKTGQPGTKKPGN